MTKILFTFDTEDFIDPLSDDTLLGLCQVFSKHGLRACFCLVTERAKVLRDRRRWDVLNVLKDHEVDSHTAFHSVHPTIAEYTEPLDWRDGVKENLLREGEALDLLKEICHIDRIWSAIKPGNSWAPQGIYAYRLLGIPTFGDGPLSLPKGRPVYYCGSIVMQYQISMEEPVLEDRVDDLLAEIRKYEKNDLLLLYAHPTMLSHSQFWDAVNFAHGQNQPWGDWIMPKRRSTQEWEQAERGMDKFLGKIKSEGYPFTTYEEIVKAAPPTPAEIDGSLTERLAEATAGRIDEYRVAEGYLSPAEVFGVLNWAMAHDVPETEKRVPVRFLLGPIDPPPKSKWASSIGASIRVESLRKAAQSLEPQLRYHVPAWIQVDDVTLPPMAYLDLVARSLVDGRTSGTITVRELPTYPATFERYGVNDIDFKGTWSIIFPEGFDAPNLVRQAHAQSWSIKQVPVC
jgi:hypothetical protein